MENEEKRPDELDVELDAARDHYERTGSKGFCYIAPTERRKIIEKYMEDHQ